MTLPLVLLHGFTGSPESFESLALADANAPALVGHRGGPSRATDFRGEVDRLAELIPPGAHVVGYSLGARLALGIALEHPQRVARATLIGVSPGLQSAAERQARAMSDERWIRLLEERGIERFVDEWEVLPMWLTQTSLPADVLARQRRIRTQHDARALAGALRALSLASMPDYGARLGELEMPVALVTGREDVKFRAIAESMRPRLRHATLTLIPDCGHNPVLERPALVAALLRPVDDHAPLAGCREARGLPSSRP